VDDKIPRIGHDVTDSNIKIRQVLLKSVSNPVEEKPLRRKMGHINEARTPAQLTGLLHITGGVMAQITGDVDIRGEHFWMVKKRITCTRTEGYTGDHLIGIA
jgi:hypothetical protein